MQEQDSYIFIVQQYPKAGVYMFFFKGLDFYRENLFQWLAYLKLSYIVGGFKLVFNEPLDNRGFSDSHIAQKYNFEFDIA